MEILTDDIRPVTDLKNKLTQLLRRVQKTRRPILLTTDGKPAALLLDVKAFGEQLAPKRLARLLRQAEKEIIQGRGRDINDFFIEFAKAKQL